MRTKREAASCQGQPALCPKSMCRMFSLAALNCRSLEVKKHSRIDTGKRCQVARDTQHVFPRPGWGALHSACVCMRVGEGRSPESPEFDFTRQNDAGGGRGEQVSAHSF